MPLNKEKKSSRLLASRRYTHDILLDSQESFTNVLDLQASEIYTQANYITSSGLPFSGSSQQGAIHTVSGSNVLKYWYRKRLTKSSVSPNEVWFFLNPTGSNSGIGAQSIDDDQQVNFISPKYSISDLANSKTEDTTPGYLATLLKSLSLNSASLDVDDVVSTNDYVFDYKTGVVQFVDDTVDPDNDEYLYMTVYQYVGTTLAADTFNPSNLLTGHITASGDISASGDFYSGLNKLLHAGNTGSFASGSDVATILADYVDDSQTGSFASGSDVATILADYVDDSQTGSFASGSDVATNITNILNLTTKSGSWDASGSLAQNLTIKSGSWDYIIDTSGSFAVTGSNVIFGEISASGNITASGNISASGTGSFSNLEIAGIGGAMLEVDGDISASGDFFGDDLNLTGYYSQDLKFGRADHTIYIDETQSGWGNGGNLTLNAGDGISDAAEDQDGGNIILTPGAKANSGDAGIVVVNSDISSSGEIFATSASFGIATDKWNDGYHGNDEFIPILPTDFALPDAYYRGDGTGEVNNSGGSVQPTYTGGDLWAQKIIPKGFTAYRAVIYGDAGDTWRAYSGRITTLLSTALNGAASTMGTETSFTVATVDGDGAAYISIRWLTNSILDDVYGGKIFIRRTL